jgi:pimeloyl-ACP methyl ester carboxylesterase
VATERRSLTRPDGREIEFLVAGPEDGLPLVLHEGTPCGLVLYSPTLRAAAVRGLRVILAARPGYEGSTPRPGRRVVDVAEDTAAVLDDLGAGTFVTLGWSGGGPHALACAAALPGRCLAAGSIAGVAPYTADGLDWLGGMGPENVAEFGAALRDEAALTGFLGREAAMMSAITGESVASSLGGLMIEADRAVLTGEFADHVAACLRTALSSGTVAGRRRPGRPRSPDARRRPPVPDGACLRSNPRRPARPSRSRGVTGPRRVRRLSPRQRVSLTAAGTGRRRPARRAAATSTRRSGT